MRVGGDSRTPYSFLTRDEDEERSESKVVREWDRLSRGQERPGWSGENG